MLKKFLHDRFVELNAVTWPTRNQAIHSSITVLVIMLIIAFLLAIMDFGFSELVNRFILAI